MNAIPASSVAVRTMADDIDPNEAPAGFVAKEVCHA